MEDIKAAILFALILNSNELMQIQLFFYNSITTLKLV